MKHLFKSLSVIALGLAALQAEAKFKVVTTFTVIQDIAQNVAGDAATVESITKPGAEIHEYEPTLIKMHLTHTLGCRHLMR